MTLTIDLLTFKVVSESRVTWSTAVPIIVFLGLSVLDLDPIYATDRQTSDVRRASSLNAPGPRGGDITTPCLVTSRPLRKISPVAYCDSAALL